jgi:hypothetical protein
VLGSKHKLGNVERKERRMKVSKTEIVFTVAIIGLLFTSSAIAIPEQELRWVTFVGNIRTGAAGAVGSGTGLVNAAGGTWVTPAAGLV